MSTTYLAPDRVRPTPASHRAWQIFGGMFVAVVLAFGAVQAAVGVAHHEYVDHDEFPASNVDVIEINNSPGSVRVVAAEAGTADTIEVTAKVSGGFKPTKHSEAIEGNRLMLRATCPGFFSSFCWVGYTVVAPPDVDVVVRSDASVTVTDMAGPVDVHTRDGHIDAARLSGTVKLDSGDAGIDATDLRSDDVDVHTGDGGVHLQFDDSPHSVRARTGDASIEVLVPDEQGIAYRVETDNGDGEIDTAVRSDPSSERSIVLKAGDGSLTVRYG